MSTYKANWDYSSSLGAFTEGDVVEFDDELAAHINRSSPGVLVPVRVHVEEPRERALDAPPSDRMVHSAKKRGGT